MERAFVSDDQLPREDVTYVNLARSTLVIALAMVLASPAVAEVVQLTASMDSPQANAGSGTGSSATGTAIVTLDTTTNLLTWNISWEDLFQPTGMHFHGPAPPNQNAGIQIATGVAGPPIFGSASIDDLQKSDLLAGLVVNLAVAKSGTDLVLSWGADCGSGDNYGVYRGDLTQGYDSIAFDLCNITPTGATIAMGVPGAEFFLVVPASNDEEGSYGASTGGARAPAPTACYPKGALDECAACAVPCDEGETCFPDAGCVVEFVLETNSISLVNGLVSELWVVVAPEWLDSDDVSLAIEITGINASFHPHGFQEVLVSATQVLVIDQGEALVSVDWTTDTFLTHSPETYTACVQPMVNGVPFGVENCGIFGPF